MVRWSSSNRRSDVALYTARPQPRTGTRNKPMPTEPGFKDAAEWQRYADHSYPYLRRIHAEYAARQPAPLFSGPGEFHIYAAHCFPYLDRMHADYAAALARRPDRMTTYAAKGDKGGGRWITIGAKEGEGGKRHGGTPVFIQGG